MNFLCRRAPAHLLPVLIGYIWGMRAHPPIRSIRTVLVSCLIVVCTGASAVASAAAAQSSPVVPKALQTLRTTLAGDLASAGGTSDALVLDTNTGQTLFSSTPDRPRLPASVEKLFTTSDSAAAVRSERDVEHERARRRLALPARNLAGHAVPARRRGSDVRLGELRQRHLRRRVGATVQQLASSLRRAGIRRITGAIVGDESAFDSLRGTPATGYAPNIEVEGELSALAFDDGFSSASEVALQPRPPCSRSSRSRPRCARRASRVPRGTKAGFRRDTAGARMLAPWPRLRSRR